MLSAVMRSTRARPRLSALVTLAMAIALAGIGVSLFAVPPEWHEPHEWSGSPSLVSAWSRSFTRVVAAGELDGRDGVAVQVWLVLVSGASAWCAHYLFRGPGRSFAAFGASIVTALACTHWAMSQPEPPTPQLAFTVLAVLTLSALVRPLVHLGHMTAPSAARALACASASALADPVAGGILALGVVGLATIRVGRRGRTRTWWWLLGAAPASTLALALLLTGSSDPVDATTSLRDVNWHVPFESAPRLTVAWPPLGDLRQFIDIHLLYPALALVGLLVVPLRWRGGLTVATLLGSALVVRNGDAPLVPLAAVLACLSIATAGWIWLAGTITRHRTTAGAAALVATTIVTVLALTPVRSQWQRPRADARYGRYLVAREVLRAVDVPGDILLVHDRVLADELIHLQRNEGLRPDLLVVDVARDLETLPSAGHPFWRTVGRRVLSDSFDHGGAWDPAVAIEMGAVFWFVFDATLAADHAVSAPLADPTTWPERERVRWSRVRLEHARFRRAVGRELDAFAMLPLTPDESRSLRASAQVARAVRLTAPGETQLARPPDWEVADIEAATQAEAGDLLYASGEHELGTGLLTRAAEGGYPAAWTALLRWHLLAGHEARASALLAELPAEFVARTVADVTMWLVARRETATAKSLLASLDERIHSPELAAARLRLLTVLAQPVKPEPAVDAIGARVSESANATDSNDTNR